MTTPLIVGAAGLELGRAFAEGWRLLRERWGQMLLALVLFGWAPQIAANVAYLTAGPLGGARSSAGAAGYVIVGLINAGGPTVMRAVATAIALAPLETSIWQAIGATLRATPALAPIWLISLAPGGAALALQYSIVGVRYAWTVALIAWPLGLFIALVLGVYSPVVIAERLGPLAATRRSFELLSGSRWKFLALYLLVQLLAAAPRFLANLAVSAHGIGARGDHVLYSADLIAGILGQDVVVIWWSAVATAVYLELARVRDGLAPRDVIEVFA